MADIALLGATGFVGRLTAAYLGRHLPEGARWQIAGRNVAELEALADAIEADDGARPEIVVADVNDADSMTRLAEGTRVLATTVGPYLRYGEAAVRACAAAGTDYVDLTGEPEFVDRMWLRYHEAAERSGARLVHACGFDSVPYDLGVLRTVQKLRPSGDPVRVRGYIRTSAMFSAGTVQSAIGQISRTRHASQTGQLRRKQEQRPPGRAVRSGGKIGRGPRGRGWALPLPTIDPQIVKRSARANPAYGDDFTYEHYAWFQRLPVMAATIAGVAVVGLAVQIGPIRGALSRLAGMAGGPSKRRRDASWFRLQLLGSAGDSTVTTEVRGGDPGYDETAVMLSESAMCLAFDELPAVTGQTTTATCMGDALIGRLVRAGITID